MFSFWHEEGKNTVTLWKETPEVQEKLLKKRYVHTEM